MTDIFEFKLTFSDQVESYSSIFFNWVTRKDIRDGLYFDSGKFFIDASLPDYSDILGRLKEFALNCGTIFQDIKVELIPHQKHEHKDIPYNEFLDSIIPNSVLNNVSLLAEDYFPELWGINEDRYINYKLADFRINTSPDDPERMTRRMLAKWYLIVPICFFICLLISEQKGETTEPAKRALDKSLKYFQTLNEIKCPIAF